MGHLMGGAVRDRDGNFPCPVLVDCSLVLFAGRDFPVMLAVGMLVVVVGVVVMNFYRRPALHSCQSRRSVF